MAIFNSYIELPDDPDGISVGHLRPSLEYLSLSGLLQPSNSSQENGETHAVKDGWYSGRLKGMVSLTLSNHWLVIYYIYTDIHIYNTIQ